MTVYQLPVMPDVSRLSPPLRHIAAQVRSLADRPTIRLTDARGDHIGTIIAVSEAGLLVKTASRFDTGQVIRAEAATFATPLAQVTSRNHGMILVRLPRSVTESDLHGPRDERGLRARAPRVRVDRAARLRVGTQLLKVRTVDLSITGAKLAMGAPSRALLEPGIALLTIDGLREAQLGELRWDRGATAGFAFDHALAVEDVYALLPQIA